ncbi:MAG: 16S rRNA (cytidine(1402)-2'-O)-methyltransferase [Melioribacteraceae bacterium]
MIESGKIFVIATPIGNLGDISERAINTLSEVDFILCEDTRVSKVLLIAKSIPFKGLISFNAFTESKKSKSILERIKNGENCAIISDAGTPCISDPGEFFIRLSHNNDIPIVGIPGPNAAIMALSMSGLPSSSFIFDGFLPQKKGRQKKLTSLSTEERTIILYESPYRINKLIEELNNYMPERYLMVFRELTKKFEEYWFGTPQTIIESLPDRTIKGEFVVVISPLGWNPDYSES